MEISKKLWEDFRKGLENRLRTKKDDLKAVWDIPEERTNLYDNLMKELAEDLGYYFRPQFLRIDYALCDKERKVPLIFIEFENNALLIAEDELRKLCCVSAPLKVIISVIEWSDEPGYWKNGGYKKIY